MVVIRLLVVVVVVEAEAEAVDDVDELVNGGDEVELAEDDDDEDAMNPLQNPLTHVLYAHIESDVHKDWKFPHRGCSIEFVA